MPLFRDTIYIFPKNCMYIYFSYGRYRIPENVSVCTNLHMLRVVYEIAQFTYDAKKFCVICEKYSGV